LIKNFKKEIELNLAQINSYLDSLHDLKQFISEKQKGQLPITLNPKAVTVFAYRLLDKGYLYELYEVNDVHRFQVALSYCNGLIYISQTLPIQLWYEGLNNGKISEIKDPVENHKFIEHLRQVSLKIVDREINGYANNTRTILLEVLQKI
jgi:hypothetical protein